MVEGRWASGLLAPHVRRQLSICHSTVVPRDVRSPGYRMRGWGREAILDLMPGVFADRRLVDIYDALHPDRSDLDPYFSKIVELGPSSLVDLDCSARTFAC